MQIRPLALRPRLLAWPLLAALAAGCAPAKAPAPAAPPAPPPVAAAPEIPKSAFQQSLDAMGVALDVPRKGRAIVVNIPSYELIALEDGEPVMRSRVIVGRDKEGDRTPQMDTETSVVRFRPSWRPTPSMVRSGLYADRIVPPGPQNPLGLLAIRLEPGSLIYLHGTNSPRLFDKQERALSSGCIRVERWDEIAAWVLGVGVEDVHAAANGPDTFDMDAWGVPVMLRYYTQFPDADGVLRSYQDVYGRETTAAATGGAAGEAAGKVI